MFNKVCVCVLTCRAVLGVRAQWKCISALPYSEVKVWLEYVKGPCGMLSHNHTHGRVSLEFKMLQGNSFFNVAHF